MLLITDRQDITVLEYGHGDQRLTDRQTDRQTFGRLWIITRCKNY